MPRVILLGTGTGLPDRDRGNTHLLWDGPGGPLLIDAGGSTYERLLRAEVDPQQLAGVFLTHSHCDHLNGFPALVFSMRLAGRETPLPIYGLAETLAVMRSTMLAMRVEPHVPLEWRAVASAASLPLADGWQIRTAMTEHSRPCLALRFEDASGTAALVYSADTAPCPAVQTLARGAAVLIHEATTPDPFAGHTSPREAGNVAATAQVGRLILVHYSPRWTMPEAEALAAIQAGGFTGPAEIGRDGQVIELATTQPVPPDEPPAPPDAPPAPPDAPPAPPDAPLALSKLVAAAEGLLMPSESDFPFAPFHWTGSAAPTDAELLAHFTLAANSPVSRGDALALLKRLASEQDWFGPEEQANAARFAKLQATVEAELSEVVLYRLGTIRITVLIAGRAADGSLVGLSTTVIET